MKRSEPKSAYRLQVEYDGSRFQGWQRQGAGQQAAGVRTVASALERCLGGSGRTDAGVHALGQVAHLHLGASGKVTVQDLLLTFDKGLPSDVAIREIRPCSPAFHARHDATARTYLYQIALRRTALAKPFVWWVKGRLDPAVLAEGWSLFQGFRDVTCFADLEDEDPRCELQACDLAAAGSLLLLRVRASHFLRRQVRRMVGAAVACAQGRARLADLRRDLERPTAEGTERWSALAAPASGLFLEHVQYPGEPGPGPLVPAAPVA
jgi:tRNA pseudouridine38-40 synthase